MHFFFKSGNGLKSYCPLKFEPKQYLLPAFWDSGLSLFFFKFFVKNLSVIYHWKGLDETITNMHLFSNLTMC